MKIILEYKNHNSSSKKMIYHNYLFYLHVFYFYRDLNLQLFFYVCVNNKLKNFEILRYNVI